MGARLRLRPHRYSSRAQSPLAPPASAALGEKGASPPASGALGRCPFVPTRATQRAAYWHCGAAPWLEGGRWDVPKGQVLSTRSREARGEGEGAAAPAKVGPAPLETRTAPAGGLTLHAALGSALLAGPGRTAGVGNVPVNQS